MKEVSAIVDESAKSLATFVVLCVSSCVSRTFVACVRWGETAGRRRRRGEGVGCAYLSNATDVLVPVLLGEAEILVQTEAHIVAVQAVACKALLEQVLLQRSRNGRLSGRRQAGEPDGGALLLAELVALLAGETRVPGDVAVGGSVWCVREGYCALPGSRVPLHS